MEAPFTFQAQLEPSGPSFMPTQIVVVPPLVLEALGGKATKRVTGTINGHAVRLGLLPLPGGGRYLMLSKELCAAIGIQLGQHLTLSLAPDPQPDYVELPAELAEALAAWPEAEARFARHPGHLRCALARHAATARQVETCARRAVEPTERLARNGHPFRKQRFCLLTGPKP